MFDEKAQLYTLEAVAAVSIMLIVIIYAIDATSMTPLTASTSSVHVEAELRAMGHDIFNILDYAEPNYSSKLKMDIAAWDGKEYIWSGSNYTIKGTTNVTGKLTNITELLNATLIKQGTAHNLDVVFLSRRPDNTTYPVKITIIFNGDPSNNAVIVSRKIVLQDSDLGSNYAGPIEDIDTNSNFRNIVDIKLTLWRM
ncbi:MAG: hypothetical protein Q8M95_04070 [Candidatus Methanoperedens sp.]|nr:hypothetical protein [Candidatus Methanoperedens sp.]